MIHKYWNMIVGSDIYPHEIVNVISDKTLEVRRMDAEQLSAAYEENQKWKCTSNPELAIFRIRKNKDGYWRDTSKCTFIESETPRRHHDYSF